MKYIVNEEKSISEVVTKTGDKLYGIIKSDVEKKIGENKDATFSDASRATYYTNVFEFPVSDISPNVGSITVEYYVYECGDYIDYSALLNKGLKINSEFDYETKYLRLIGFLVNDKLYRDLKSTIYHELTHLYQYSKGMQKRKELYDMCVEFNESPIQAKKVIGHLTYYTFPHEQDAMVHQFYADLMEINPNKTFDDCLTEISEYKNIISCMYFIRDYGDETVQYINQLGMTVKQWLQRVRFANKRIINKMRNAYIKFRMDKNKRSINENMLNFDLYMESFERHKKNLKHGLESFYTEYSLPNEGLFDKYLK